jgi:predicted metal-dependent HD superfamily phosphohydrolase
VSDPNQNNWVELWGRIGAVGDPLPVYQSLVKRYAEPHRAYHNLGHVQDCLQEFENARSLATDADAVEVAIWFHDAVYDPKAKDNEELSAQLAEYLFQAADLLEAFTEKVTRLILATKHDAPPENKDAALLIDIDLSILGQPREKFAEYEAAIRQEYAWADSAEFAAGRCRLLREFLKRPSIYQTDFFRAKYEETARKNVQWAVVRLDLTP